MHILWDLSRKCNPFILGMSVAQQLWNRLRDFCKQKGNRTVNLNLKNIMFARIVPKPFDCINTNYVFDYYVLYLQLQMSQSFA